MLTPHQRLHVQAVLSEAPVIAISSARNRVITACNDLLDGTAEWPDPYLDESDIANWLEDAERKADLQVVIDALRARDG